MYLDGAAWSEVTRDERFFCQHLYSIIQQKGEDEFVSYLIHEHQAQLSATENWEVAYEVCFYRDLWHHRKKQGPLFSPKRTFDLCLFSDNAIVVIEAKVHQEFDPEQLKSFEKDRTQLEIETEVANILISGLASGQYKPDEDVLNVFNGPYLTWSELSQFYDDDLLLKRADEIYEPDQKRSWGRHNTGGYKNGEELLDAFERGEEFFVGRYGGLEGPQLAEDINSGAWRSQRYETNRESTEAPSPNWFRLSEFMSRINETG
jgi:hypothetical protein